MGLYYAGIGDSSEGNVAQESIFVGDIEFKRYLGLVNRAKYSVEKVIGMRESSLKVWVRVVFTATE